MDVIARTQTSTCYKCPLFYQARNMMINEIRELTIVDTSCELLLYGSAELGIIISKSYDVVHWFFDETGRL